MILALLLLSCKDDTSKTNDSGPAGETGGAAEQTATVVVTVTLDGEPVEDVWVGQPGTDRAWRTDAAGQVTAELDLTVDGAVGLAASHPEARIGGDELTDSDLTSGVFAIELVRYVDIDNEAFAYAEPGSPDNNKTTLQCAHCHITINEDWFTSPHARSASNPAVQDLYAGAAAALADEETCTEAGGTWASGRLPGDDATGLRCYLGSGVLPDLNDCTAPCDEAPEQTGQCADCHAPGMDGAVGGRDLLDAVGVGYEGVHCDLCHKVESVNMDSVDPGVAGRLRLLRPSEESLSPAMGEWQPIMFGPYPDVLNPFMGGVQRDLYREGEICAGCHQYEQAVMVPGQLPDPERWPGGRLPVHTTWDEHESSPTTSGYTCQTCHMTPALDVGNSADLGNELAVPNPGMSSGWYRSPGSVARHIWWGPRNDTFPLIDTAANLSLDVTADGSTVSVEATVLNFGGGHALPTGEPQRHLLLLVQATCSGRVLEQVGGSVVPDFGGWLDRKDADESWATWEGARVGDLIRVVRRTGEWYDYTGFGPFGDGTFSAEDKGMPVEELAGQATVTTVDGDVVTLDAELPEGDVAYRVRSTGLPDDGDSAGSWAGAPGFGFARVMVGADGRRMVPHYQAVDVASDNRLLPSEQWTSELSFAGTCSEPAVDAVLVYRAYELGLATERGWDVTDRKMKAASN